MPTNENTQFQNKNVPVGLVSAKGSLALRNSSMPTPSPGGYKACEFIRWSGNTDYPDLLPGQSANVTVVSAGECPKGCRPYVTGVVMQLLGCTGWSNTSPTAGSVPSVYLQSSISGAPALSIPFSALDTNASFAFPAPETRIPIFLGEAASTSLMGAPAATFTYVQSTGVITASATMFVSGVGVGSVVQVLQGGGYGQSAVITGITGTTVTVSPPFTGINDHASVAKDTVLGVHAWTVKTATDTTHSTIQNAAGTPFTANALASGLNAIGVAGTGSGQVVPIIANTTAGALTYGYALAANFDTTTSMLAITDNVGIGEAIQTGISSFFPITTAYALSTQTGDGLVWAVNNQAGTSPLGAAVRWGVWGFWAP